MGELEGENKITCPKTITIELHLYPEERTKKKKSRECYRIICAFYLMYDKA